MDNYTGEHTFSQTLDFNSKHRSVVEGTSNAKITMTEQERKDFCSDGRDFLSGIDDFYEGLITPETYIKKVFVGLWTKIGEHRRSIPSTSQILSSVPSSALAGLLCDVPAMFVSLGKIYVGTEISCVSGTAEDGTPMTKNQDVAIYFKSPEGMNVPLIAWEVKENYIDKTMLEGTKSTGLSTMAVFKHARTEVMTPAITGGKPGRHVKMRILCPSQTGRQAGNRRFDESAILAIRTEAIDYLKTLDRETIEAWVFPDYDTFVVSKILLELDGQPRALNKLKTALA